MIDENCKLLYCLDYDSTFENIKEETPEFLAEYICKINNTYNKLVDRIINLQQENKQLKDNWNKLKEYIEETKLKEFEKSYGKRYGKTFTQEEIIVCNMIKEKMQELEGSEN